MQRFFLYTFADTNHLKERRKNLRLINRRSPREHRMDLDISTLRTDDRDDGRVGKKKRGTIHYLQTTYIVANSMIDETIFTGENGLSMDDADREFAKLINLLVCYQQLSAENKQLKQRVAELEEEHERLLEAQEQQKKVDEWASRVRPSRHQGGVAGVRPAVEREA